MAGDVPRAKPNRISLGPLRPGCQTLATKNDSTIIKCTCQRLEWPQQSGRETTMGSFHGKVNLKNGQNEIVFDSLWYPLSILLLAAIGAKLIGPHGGLQVDKEAVS